VKFLQQAKFKIKKNEVIDFRGFQLPEVREKMRNYIWQSFLTFGFECAAEDVEGVSLNNL
jgi:hypothetical protein